MLILKGTKTVDLSKDELTEIIGQFDRVHIDLGTGVSVGRFSPFRVGLKTPISVNLKSPMHHVCY